MNVPPGSSGSSAFPQPGPRALSPLGRPRVHLRCTDSTNDRARALALSGAPHGTLVTASAQTAGRGRHGRRWSAPADSSLLMSLLLRCPPPLLPLIAAVAVCDVAGDQATIKWPNDIVVARSPAPSAIAPSQSSVGAGVPAVGTPTLVKLAGILVEGRPQQGWAVLGIGLNVAVRPADLPPELRGGAATLGEPSDAIEPLLTRLLAALQRWLESPLSATLDAWRARDALWGREIAWSDHEPGDRFEHGRAEGIDGAGRLIVVLPDGGRTTLDAGEVHLRDVR
jgi:BirA family biotin operon repressor/biotin-[acetyl-CoA-carboxylase] ligase